MEGRLGVELLCADVPPLSQVVLSCQFLLIEVAKILCADLPEHLEINSNKQSKIRKTHVRAVIESVLHEVTMRQGKNGV